MKQNNKDASRSLFFGFIISCAIAAIFALGLVAQGGGQTGGFGAGFGGAGNNSGFMGSGEGREDDDD